MSTRYLEYQFVEATYVDHIKIWFYDTDNGANGPSFVYGCQTVDDCELIYVEQQSKLEFMEVNFSCFTTNATTEIPTSNVIVL